MGIINENWSARFCQNTVEKYFMHKNFRKWSSMFCFLTFVDGQCVSWRTCTGHTTDRSGVYLTALSLENTSVGGDVSGVAPLVKLTKLYL